MIAVDSGRLQLAGSRPECHNNKLGAIPQFNYNQITALTGLSKTLNLKKCKDNQLIRSSSLLNEYGRNVIIDSFQASHQHHM